MSTLIGGFKTDCLIGSLQVYFHAASSFICIVNTLKSVILKYLCTASSALSSQNHQFMWVLAVLGAHWYLSLFTQSFFNHRYAAHRMFTMSKGVEKFFYVISWVFQGSSYLSPRAYGIMHRMHHAYADTELDPHSPKYDANLFAMMWRTRNTYLHIFEKSVE